MPVENRQEFIQDLSNSVYDAASVRRASDYCLTRKLNMSEFSFPWALTSEFSVLFNKFRNYYPPDVFTRCLYIPVTEIIDGRTLVGFDARYVGDEEHRLKYRKFKAGPHIAMVYSTHNFSDIDPTKPVLVTEGAIDAESLRFFGCPVIFVMFLASLSSKVYLMYDNDDNGRAAVQKILKIASMDEELTHQIQPIIYSGEDPNKVLCQSGRGYLEKVLSSQVELD
jgi:hypothetical protein